jgi:hypothetical protein
MEHFFEENVPLLKKFPHGQKIVKYMCVANESLFEEFRSIVSECAKIPGPVASLISGFYRDSY